MLILILTAFCGCVQLAGIQGIFKPKPTITPAVTVTPAPPTVTPAPSPAARQMNTAVKIMPFGEKGLVAFDSTKDLDVQREKITVVVANDGSADAKNVVLTLTITDAHGANTLVQQKYEVGDLRKGDRKECAIETEDHGLASSVLIDINVEWGENSEYYNPTTFIHVAKSIWK